jgi:ATP-dependent Clp protease ATP-binding subunit ClpA
MPKINVYLPDDLAEAVKDAGLPVSAVCQRALEQAVRRVTAIREVAAGGTNPDLIDSAAVLPFTARAMRLLQAAQAEAAADGLAAFDTAYLLRAVLSDGDSMAVRVLGALDITPRQVRAELDRRVAAASQHATAASAGPSATLSTDAAKAVELATNEASGLGNSYLGTEHLLLGLISEPAGAAGHALRALGADLRVTRRTVAAALAGYGAGAAAQRASGRAPADPADLAPAIRAELTPAIRAELTPAIRAELTPAIRAEFAPAIRAELTPVLARLERLESRLAD